MRRHVCCCTCVASRAVSGFRNEKAFQTTYSCIRLFAVAIAVSLLCLLGSHALLLARSARVGLCGGMVRLSLRSRSGGRVALAGEDLLQNETVSRSVLHVRVNRALLIFHLVRIQATST